VDFSNGWTCWAVGNWWLEIARSDDESQDFDWFSGLIGRKFPIIGCTAATEKEVGVPILSKIPIIGRAFANRSKVADQKILLILVKPTIILQEEADAEALQLWRASSKGLIPE